MTAKFYTMKKYSCQKLFVLFLLVSFYHLSFAQTNISADGIVKEELKTKDGSIIVIHTANLPRGKTISGTVIAEPASDNINKRLKQKKNLQQLILKVGEETISNNGIFTIKLPDVAELSVQLFSSEGKLIDKILLHLGKPKMPGSLQLPSVIRKEYTERISGDFSGDISEPALTIGNKPAKVIAGNNHELFFETFDVEPGKQELSLNYDETKVTKTVNVIDYTLQAGSMTLDRGESTYLDVKVLGLKDIEEPLIFKVQNQSVGTVSLEGGEQQSISIAPEEVAITGVWQKRFTIQSKTRGSFSVQTNLEIPREEISYSNESGVVSCNLNGEPVLVTIAECEKLCSGLEDSPPKENPWFSTQVAQPEMNLSSGQFQLKPGDKMSLHVNFSDGFEPAFTLFNLIDLETGEVLQTLIDSVFSDSTSAEFSEKNKPGLYSVQAITFFGTGQKLSAQQLYYQNGLYSYSGISSDEIRRLDDELENARDSVERDRARYDRLGRSRDEHWRHSQDEDEAAYEVEEIASQLAEIDKVLDQVEDTYGDNLHDLLDSIMRYPPRPDTAALSSYVDDLQAELDECQKQLAELEKEKEQLETDIPDMEHLQLAAYQKIVSLFKGTGYNFTARHSRDAGGNFNYSYSVVLGTSAYQGYVPAEIASQVQEQENQLKNLAQQLQQAQARLGELPQIIADKQKECDELTQRLNEAKNTLKEGKELAENYSAMQLDREDICRRIKALTQRLVRWCENHPDLCNFKNDLETLLENCPEDTLQAQWFWRNYNNILNAKKQIENNYHDSAERHGENAKREREASDNDQEEMDDLWDELGRLARRISNLEKQKAQAIRDEQARRARMAREKKRACEKILESQGIDPANASVLKDLEDIKDQIQDIGGMISDASKLGTKIPNQKVQEMADKLGENIDKILGPLKKYDELKEKADELLDIKDKLETIMSEGDSPSERAAKFGAYLELVNKIVGEIGDKFPILKFFTAYFDYLVQGYLAAVNGAEAAFNDRYTEIIESAMERINCETLLNKYMENNSFDEMYGLAYQLCGASYYGQNDWQKTAFEKIVREKALKKIIDCCLDRLSR